MANNLVIFLFAGLVSTCIDVEAATADVTAQVKDYDAKVCNNEPTCDLIPLLGLTAEKVTLPWRDCMCDSECSEYEDCCQDSEYLKSPKLYTPAKSYQCSPLGKVYMVVSCLPDFKDEHIKENCAKALKPLEEDNFHLIIPVTNVEKNITYANGYCALCNNEKNGTKWEFTTGCGEPAKGALERRAAEVKKEQAAASSAKSAATTTTAKPKHNHLNVNLHLGSHNKTITIPTFGNIGSKLANKTIGSDTGIFGAKTSVRRKRETDLGSLDFNKYARKVKEIVNNKLVKYDPSVKEFIAKFENKTLVCKLGSKMPEKLRKSVRACLPHVISECPNDEAANKVCQSYLSFVHDAAEKKTYRNIDCAKCNGVDPKAAKLMGCYKGSRVGGSSLFASGSTGCDPALKGTSFC